MSFIFNTQTCLFSINLIAKRIQKFLLNRLDPERKAKLNKELKRFPEIDNVSENTRNGFDTRGGVSPVVLWVTKVVVLNFAVKVAIAGSIGATV